MSSVSPTSRTLALLRKKGYATAIVERWLQHAGPFGMRQDMFGIIDIVAIKPGRTIGVQSCGSAFSNHHAKLLKSLHAILWLLAGNELVLVGWRKIKKKRGGKQMIWSPRTHNYSLADFPPENIEAVTQAIGGELKPLPEEEPHDHE